MEEPEVKVPTESQLTLYTETRPWSSEVIEKRFRDPTSVQPSTWPSTNEAPALRKLLEDDSAVVRGIAAEALATLLLPEDAPRLAELLDDSSMSVPILLHAGFSGTHRIGKAAAPPDSIDWSQVWRTRTVASYARSGIKLITGREFTDKTAFHQWWQRNANARHCLWHWQLRMQRTMDEIESRVRLNPDPAKWAEEMTAAKIPAARQILEELKQLPPEVEAKVRLLTVSKNAGGAPITGSEEEFWPEPPALRLPAERLLDLLDRKNLWEDVDWDRAHYNLLAERLGMWADMLFKPTHADRLNAVLERETDELWWSGQAALIVGISRLQPAEEAGTRDMILRDAVSNEPDLFVRGHCAMELVRVGLPENADFLHRIAFEPTKDSGSPDVMKGILQALARPPLDKPKRALLADIVLDDRFKDSWTRRNAQMGDDMNRTYAVMAVNAHAGQTLIPEETKYALLDPAKFAAALEKVRADIKLLLAKP